MMRLHHNRRTDGTRHEHMPIVRGSFLARLVQLLWYVGTCAATGYMLWNLGAWIAGLFIG